jgi:cytochrome P450
MSVGAKLLGELLDPASRPDPYPIYTELRQASPLWIDPMSAAVVAGYDDCEALLRDPRLSAERWRRGGSLDLPADAPSSVRQPWFLSLDPPDHTRLRRLVSKAFTARRVAELEPYIAGLVDDLLDAAAERNTVDVVADLAYPLPVAVICRLLGVPVADEHLFHRWSAQLSRLVDGLAAMVGGAAAPDWVPGMVEMHRYVHELVAARRTAPGDDLISALLAVEDGGETLSRDELVATVVLLLVAGHETTVNLIANGVLALLRHPEHLAAVRADPGYAAGVVEETLRYDPPVQLTSRIADEPVRIGEVRVDRNGLVFLMLAAAQRDPAANPDPDRFDPRRTQIRHLAFGLGPHYCLGAPLARLEGRLAIAAFARRISEPTLIEDPPPYRAHLTLRGPEAVLVAVGS